MAQLIGIQLLCLGPLLLLLVAAATFPTRRNLLVQRIDSPSCTEAVAVSIFVSASGFCPPPDRSPPVTASELDIGGSKIGPLVKKSRQ
jgi:hypothetical protein